MKNTRGNLGLPEETTAMSNKETTTLVNELIQSSHVKTNTISDGFHTFGELYRYRMLLQAMLFNTAGRIKEFPVMKSWRHSDGELCFGKENYFVVVANLPTGQVTNHYAGEHWDLFHIDERERASEWDGHTPQEAAKRMEDYIKGDWPDEKL